MNPKQAKRSDIGEDSYDEVAPDASSMIESMRAHGYTLSTAVSDIIDNSIAASCQNVWLNFYWNSRNSWISVTDDGVGMSEQELVTAMRLGSMNPMEKRAKMDLGRFGLGLKTASFSQARRLTVTSKTKNGIVSLRRWDLDHLAKPDVKGWQLLKNAHPNSDAGLEGFESLSPKSGTHVLLESLDRVVLSEQNKFEQIAEDHWVSEVRRVREHLAMVFHRFLADTTRRGIKIWLNGTKVDAWDPFCVSEEATQEEPEDRNSDLGGTVIVKGYVLPHRDRFDPDDIVNSKKLHQLASGTNGWNAHQGFYLYRNRRLIIPGSWLGLGPGRNGWIKEEHFKLARIQIDIPNSMDHEWQIDVKKSTANAPPVLRGWLTGLAKRVREKARQVYAHRGGRLQKTRRRGVEQANAWISKTDSSGSFGYQINREYPLFRALRERLPSGSKEELETLFRLIEETVPVQQIWIDTAEKQDGLKAPFEGENSDSLKKLIKLCHSALVANGQNSEDAWEELAVFPGFQARDSQALIGQLRE